MGFTNYALELMGYRKLDDGEELSAAFTSVHVFEVQGLTGPLEGLIVDQGKLGGIGFGLALSSSLNEACVRIANDTFATDEQAWATEHRCGGPYLLLSVGPTSLHTMKAGYLQEVAGEVHTYDGFLSARAELKEAEAKVVPALLTGLSCVFGNHVANVRFRKLQRAASGRSTSNKTVHDVTLTMNAQLSTSQIVPADELAGLLSRSIQLASGVGEDVARFFHLGIGEADPTKRFLSFFMTVERQTHATYKSASSHRQLSTLSQVPGRLRMTCESFLTERQSQPDEMKNLQDRFLWCALMVWAQVSDDDVQAFRQVKKVRDRIAHGEVSSASAVDVAKVERLAVKLQLAA